MSLSIDQNLRLDSITECNNTIQKVIKNLIDDYVTILSPIRQFDYCLGRMYRMKINVLCNNHTCDLMKNRFKSPVIRFVYVCDIQRTF